MDLSTQLHAMAGLGAVALGIGVLTRAPTRSRNRLFSALCAALAIWNLGIFAQAGGAAPDFPWRALFLIGGCSAAPLAVHFAVVVTGVEGRTRHLLLGVAYVAASALWLSAWLFTHSIRAWNVAALFVLGALLVTALAILGREVVRLPAGRERATLRLVVAAGVLGVGGGLSDFFPRGVVDFPKVGPLFVLLFLLIVSAVVVRHHFLDVDVYLARVAALITGATGVALVLFAVTRSFGARFLPLLLTSLAILAAVGPLGRLLLTRTRGFLTGDDPLAEALMATSRKLEAAREPAQVWDAIDDGNRALPRGVRLSIYLRTPDASAFDVVYPSPSPAGGAGLAAESAVPTLLERDRSPLTQRLLEIEWREGTAQRRRVAREAHDHMTSMESAVVVPLFGDDRLIGWLSLGGGDPQVYLRGEVAAALAAVGQQAVASLARIRVVEDAKRHEALAAVGEMAAGLAHEVRNPVAAIRGAAQAITPSASADQATEMLDVIQEETARLDRVVGEFLDYARPGSPRRERVNLGEVAQRVTRDARLAGFDLRIELAVEDTAPPALGDPDQIRRAFENLVRNAAEASGPGGSLEIRVTAAGGRVAVRFEDHGPGIPEEHVATLFQPFRTTREGGTGLGLALVHRIVEAHGGEIRVDGRPGVGAVFTVELPAATSNEVQKESVPGDPRLKS